MNDNHRLTPEELDAYLTARQQGQNPDLSVASALPEIKLAENIINLAEAAQPDAEFAADLEAQLASRQQPGKQQPSGFTERKITMFRRILLPLAGAATLLLLAIFILPKFTAKPLEPLPPISGAKDNAGLAISAESAHGAPAPNVAPAVAGRETTLDTRVGGGGGIYMGGTFSGTEFILQTELPGMPDKITVYQQTAAGTITIDTFRKLAEQFGLQGTIYTQAMPIIYTTRDAVEPAPGVADQPISAPTSYILFDGTRQLTGGDWSGIYYYDRGVALFAQTGGTPAADQLIPIAEAFLKEHGLLNFSYRAELNPYQSDMVSFYRLIDNKPLTTSEIEIQIGVGNQIASIYYNLFDIQATGDYPIRSAQAVWDDLLANNITWEQMSFWTITPPMPPDPGYPIYRGWQPEYHPGETAEVLGYLMMYQPAEGESGPMRLTLGDLELSLSDTDRQTLIGLADRQLLISGQIRQTERGGLVLEVSGWQESELMTQDYTGTIQRQGENALLLRADGVTFWLPHTPATLNDGLQVSCYGWETGRQENGYPVIEWNYVQTPPIEDRIAPPTIMVDSPLSVEGVGVDPAIGIPEPVIDTKVGTTPIITEGTGTSSSGGSTAGIGIAEPVPDQAVTPPNFGPGNTAEAVEGQLFATVFGNEDGSFTYSIQLNEMSLSGQGWYVELTGSQLEALSKLDRQWVRVWGRYEDQEWPVLNVERFEAVDPSRTVQAWLGQVITETIEGQTVNVLVTIPDQQHLVIASSVRWPDAYLYTAYELGRQTIFEGVLRSDTFGGYPVLEDINWVADEAVDQMTSASEYMLPARPEVYPYIPPPPLLPGKAYVDQVELVYTITYTYVEETNTSLQFVQPAWRFSGYTDDGTRFVILMQAVDAEYIQEVSE